MAEQQTEITRRQGREGSRWVNERPSGDDVAAWFKDAVELPEGLKHDRYVSGVTLIPNTEKSKEIIGFRDNGTPILNEQENLVYTPYVKVETRVQFFHDLMALHGDDWEGIIEPVRDFRRDDESDHLPPGFFFLLVREDNNSVVRYLCCSMKVTVYKRGTIKWEAREVKPETRHSRPEIEWVRTGETIIDAPPATKMVPVRRKYADPNSIMKAETGAVGRALGLAGMLVVPGSGVATAEDLQEAQTLAGAQTGGGAEGPEQASLPVGEEAGRSAAAEPTLEELQAQIRAKVAELAEEHPERHKQFLAWCKEKKIGMVSDLDLAGAKGVVRKLDKTFDEIAQAQQG